MGVHTRSAGEWVVHMAGGCGHGREGIRSALALAGVVSLLSPLEISETLGSGVHGAPSLKYGRADQATVP